MRGGVQQDDKVSRLPSARVAGLERGGSCHLVEEQTQRRGVIHAKVDGAW